MQDVIGFDYQGRHTGNCAQRALMHALLLLGRPISEDRAHKLTDRPEWLTEMRGTDEEHLKNGIHAAGFKAAEFNVSTSEQARGAINHLLDSGIPVIISVQEGEHWAVLAGKHGWDEYYWIDSADEELYGCWHWGQIAEWMEDAGQYYFIGITPHDRRDLRHSAVPAFGKMFALFDDDQLAEYWGWYLEDLLESFNSPHDEHDVMGPAEFFEKYGSIIYNASCHYYIYADEEQMRWELNNYRQVAEMHNLTVSRGNIPRAVANLSAALTCIACMGETR